MSDNQEAFTEEKTEPFSQSEYNRLPSFTQIANDLDAAVNDTVPLDHLVVDDHHHEQGVRILVRPRVRNRSVSPGSDNCHILALRAEVESQSEHKVLAVTQTAKDIKFSVRIPEDIDPEHSQPRPPTWCELYYDPRNDNQILVNRGDVPITLKRSVQGQESPTGEFQIVPGSLKALTPGTWKLRTEDIPVLDFRILEKRPRSLSQTTSDSDLSSLSYSSGPPLSGKRSFSEGQLSPEKRLRTAERGDNGAIVFMTPQPLVIPFPRTSAKSDAHPMIDMQPEETVNVDGGCELDTYQLTKRTPLHSTKLSTVFTADAKHPAVPESVSTITVKVLKTAVSPDSKHLESERNVIRQADGWLRELETQQNLDHKSIVRLYAGDARYLSLYMEHVDARDLAVKGVWRDAESDLFVGNQNDARRILRDISGGLNYLHQKNLVHNDIKPANILYSTERGAVLCDFGLTTPIHDRATNGGTPYYVPPEYIGGKLRGRPSDVWGLGVAMLYVLRKIPFPETRSNKKHQKHLYWHISEVNKPLPRSRKAPGPPTAMDQMKTWLKEVNMAVSGLNKNDDLESLVADMLDPNPLQRITMAQVIGRLGSAPQKVHKVQKVLES